MIYVTGSLAFDFIMDYPGKFADQIVPDKIHVINLSFLVNTLKEGKGGTAGNIAYNLSLLKNVLAIVGSAGKDFDEYHVFLKKQNIATDFIHIVKNDYTARAYITTDLADNQITGFYPGALRNDKNLSIAKAIKQSNHAAAQPFVIIAPDDPEAMAHYVDECIALKIPFMFDPGMQLPRLPVEVLVAGVTHADIIIGNDYEMALLKSKIQNSPTQKKQIYVTTLGEKGSVIEIKNQSRHGGTKIKSIKIKPARVRKAVDPTGAGDAYRAGFLTGYLQGKALRTCGQMGSIAAVYAVEKYGTMEHYYTVDEFRERYKDDFGKLKNQ